MNNPHQKKRLDHLEAQKATPGRVNLFSGQNHSTCEKITGLPLVQPDSQRNRQRQLSCFSKSIILH